MWEWIAAWGVEEWGIAGGVAGVAAWLGLTPQNARWGWRRLLGKKDEPAEVRLVPSPPPPPAPPIGILNLPPGRNVVGRATEVADLHASLQAGGAGVAITNVGTVVKGQGGFGKSTLARHYAEVHGGAYHGGVWTHAGTRQAVIDGLMALNVPLGLPVPDQPQLPHAQAVLAAVRATGKRWLFIYDNVEDFEDIRGLIPDGAALIVTTRQGTGWPGWKVQETGVLPFDTPDAPAVDLLLQEAPQGGPREQAQALAVDLGGLPLALVVAGGILRAERTTFAALRPRLAEVIAARPANEDYPTSLTGAVALSWGALDADAQMVADLCAWWAPEGLAAGLISDAPAGRAWAAVRHMVPEPLQALALDPARVRAAFRALEARSLITSDGAEGWAMHRMTAAVLRAMQAQGGRGAGAAAAGLLAAVFPGGGDRSPAFSANWPVCARLTPHVRALWETGAAPAGEAMEYLLNQTSVYLDKIADYPGALTLAEASLTLKRARLPDTHRSVALALCKLGVALRRVGRLDEGEARLAEAVALHEAHRPGSPADLANSYDLHGGVLLAMAQAGRAGVLPRAAKRHQQALALWRRAGRRSDDVAGALNNLAAVRREQGRGAAAARLVAAALAIRRDVLPPGDARLAAPVMNTGASWLEARRADRAEPLLREALEILEAALAAQPQHPDRRNAAGWLISCLLVRAAAGENRGLREMQARQLCDRYGFDLAERQATVARYPYTPPAP